MFKKVIIGGAFFVVVGCSGTQVNQGPSYTPFTDYPVAKANKLGASDLARLADSLGGVQGGFEKDADFHARMRKIPSFEVCKRTTQNSLKFDPKTGRTAYKEFLSEAQISGYREENGETFSDSKLNFPSVELEFSSKKAGEYVGQNAFGATAVVDIRMAEVVHLVFEPMPTGGVVFPHPFLSADASGLEQSGVQLCMTVEPVAPFYRESVLHASPTISNPSSGEVKHMFFRVKIGTARLADLEGNTLTDKVAFDPGIY